jgi:hypothetical protein
MTLVFSPLISLKLRPSEPVAKPPRPGSLRGLGRYFSIVIGPYTKAARHVGRLLQKLRFCPVSAWPRRPLKERILTTSCGR